MAFMPLWQMLLMDLGFSRRQSGRKGAIDPTFDFRTLLARISARQAALPTARIQARCGRDQQPCLSEAPDARFFADPDRNLHAGVRTASFSAAVATLLVAGRQSS